MTANELRDAAESRVKTSDRARLERQCLKWDRRKQATI